MSQTNYATFFSSEPNTNTTHPCSFPDLESCDRWTQIFWFFGIFGAVAILLCLCGYLCNRKKLCVSSEENYSNYTRMSSEAESSSRVSISTSLDSPVDKKQSDQMPSSEYEPSLPRSDSTVAGPEPVALAPFRNN